jgi:hypothetical protein
MNYRKLPIKIEAVVFNGTTQWDEAPQWLINATRKRPSETGAITVAIYDDPAENRRVGTAHINTLEGVMTANPGDYIIRGVNGELYPCKPDIFAKTYEECGVAERTSNPTAQTKQFRKELDDVLQRLKKACDHTDMPSQGITPVQGARSNRERSIAITKLQEAIMWLGMDLKDIGETPNPYPQSYNPESPAIEPTADGLKM